MIGPYSFTILAYIGNTANEQEKDCICHKTPYNTYFFSIARKLSWLAYHLLGKVVQFSNLPQHVLVESLSHTIRPKKLAKVTSQIRVHPGLRMDFLDYYGPIQALLLQFCNSGIPD